MRSFFFPFHFPTAAVESAAIGNFSGLIGPLFVLLFGRTPAQDLERMRSPTLITPECDTSSRRETDRRKRNVILRVHDPARRFYDASRIYVQSAARLNCLFIYSQGLAIEQWGTCPMSIL